MYASIKPALRCVTEIYFATQGGNEDAAFEGLATAALNGTEGLNKTLTALYTQSPAPSVTKQIPVHDQGEALQEVLVHG